MNSRFKVRRIRPMESSKWFFRFTVSILRIYINLKVSRVSQNEEKIPQTGAAIVIAPHMTNFDAMLAPEFVTRAGRVPRILAKKSLWKIPLVKQAFNSGRLIPVERNTNSSNNSLIEAEKALVHGDIVFIFPEGTHTKDPDFWPMKIKTGAARLVIKTRVPVIPVLQDGQQFLLKSQKNRTELAWWGKYHNRKRIVVHLKAYDSIDFSDIFRGNYSDEDLLIKVNQRIESTLTEIVSQSRGVVAPTIWDNKTICRGV